MRAANGLLFAALRIAGFAVATERRGNSSSPQQRPNFVLIITDDQDLHLQSLNYMPGVQKHFTDQGKTFNKHFCTVSLCCPSRVSLLTGRAAHNTNVTDILPPYGGYSQFVAEGWNDHYLPVWLQENGYNTYYAGKLMNGYSTSNYKNPSPNGWTSRDFLLDPNTYIYYEPIMQKDNDSPRFYANDYSTDLVAEKSLSFLDDAIAANKPFFLGIAPIAPHAETVSAYEFAAPVAAERHQSMYQGLQAPRTTNFNPDEPSGGGWIGTLEKLNQTVVDYLDDWYRQRILALQSVDDMVDSIAKRLNEDPDVLENTYLIYTTDNGYHLGQHRLAPGKTCPIEEDINIPFIIRGPGIDKGTNVSIPTSHIDVVPTLFQLAGIPLQEDFDGEPMPVTSEQSTASTNKSEHINVEYWGYGINEGQYPGDGDGVLYASGLDNTYKLVRVISYSYDLAYMVWCTNEHELYDVANDPGQMNNLYNSTKDVKINGWAARELIPRLDALLLTLKSCKGQVCRKPWETLHPQGNVHNLEDAMNSEFDDFYTKEQLNVTFTACALGYLPQYEGATGPIPYNGGNWSIYAK